MRPSASASAGSRRPVPGALWDELLETWARSRGVGGRRRGGGFTRCSARCCSRCTPSGWRSCGVGTSCSRGGRDGARAATARGDPAEEGGAPPSRAASRRAARMGAVPRRERGRTAGGPVARGGVDRASHARPPGVDGRGHRPRGRAVPERVHGVLDKAQKLAEEAQRKRRRGWPSGVQPPASGRRSTWPTSRARPSEYVRRWDSRPVRVAGGALWEDARRWPRSAAGATAAPVAPEAIQPHPSASSAGPARPRPAALSGPARSYPRPSRNPLCRLLTECSGKPAVAPPAPAGDELGAKLWVRCG